MRKLGEKDQESKSCEGSVGTVLGKNHETGRREAQCVGGELVLPIGRAWGHGPGGGWRAVGYHRFLVPERKEVWTCGAWGKGKKDALH
jgi:hypothetical protein